MEVNSSSQRIEKFNGRLGTISLREFNKTFSIVVCELDPKYGTNYTKMFAFKQLACYVHYEALDVYEQHSPKNLSITQIPNLVYATTIATTSQAALQATIAHHGIVPNNLDLVPTSINLSPQHLIIATINILSIIDAPTFANPVWEFFRVLELEFPIKSSENFLQLATSFQQKDETLKMLYKKFLKLKEDTQSIPNLEVAHWYVYSLEGTSTFHVQVSKQIFAKFGDLYNLLDVYNISEKLQLAHAHYEASTMRPPTRSRP
jgi:hypothetical protein